MGQRLAEEGPRGNAQGEGERYPRHRDGCRCADPGAIGATAAKPVRAIARRCLLLDISFAHIRGTTLYRRNVAQYPLFVAGNGGTNLSDCHFSWPFVLSLY